MNVIVYTECWGSGGIEMFLMNIFRSLKANESSFLLFSTWDWNDGYDEELSRLGVERHAVFHGSRPNQVKRLTAGAIAFARALDEEPFDVAYINTMNGMGFLYSEVARRKGVPVRVVHSHNSAFGPGMAGAKAVAHRLGRALFSGSATARLACSGQAGRYLFGEEPFDVVNNGIDVERFRFKPESRSAIRSELGLAEGDVLIGNIGRLAPAKNPLFQLEVFAEFLKIRPSTKYLMLGAGELEGEIRERADKLGIADRLVLHAPVGDTAPWYCALDAFLMPSVFEGMATVRVEAQCSGLPLLISDNQAHEGDITPLTVRCSLKESASAWAERLYSLVVAARKKNRSLWADAVAGAGFSVESAAKAIQFALQKR